MRDALSDATLESGTCALTVGNPLTAIVAMMQAKEAHSKSGIAN